MLNISIPNHTKPKILHGNLQFVRGLKQFALVLWWRSNSAKGGYGKYRLVRFTVVNLIEVYWKSVEKNSETSVRYFQSGQIQESLFATLITILFHGFSLKNYSNKFKCLLYIHTHTYFQDWSCKAKHLQTIPRSHSLAAISVTKKYGGIGMESCHEWPPNPQSWIV